MISTQLTGTVQLPFYNLPVVVDAGGRCIVGRGRAEYPSAQQQVKLLVYFNKYFCFLKLNKDPVYYIKEFVYAVYSRKKNEPDV